MSAKQSKTALIEAAGAEFSLSIEGRDAGVLHGPEPFLSGGLFLECLGVYENYTVAHGLPVGCSATCKRNRLFGAGLVLLQELTRDADLLSFDYSFGFPKFDKTRLKRFSAGFSIRGLMGFITAQPRGFCTLELKQGAPAKSPPRTVEMIDLRQRTEIETDDRGPIRIYKKPAPFKLIEPISQFVQFLKEHRCEDVRIRFV